MPQNLDKINEKLQKLENYECNCEGLGAHAPDCNTSITWILKKELLIAKMRLEIND